MNGSEKQIKWAEDIKSAMLAQVDRQEREAVAFPDEPEAQARCLNGIKMVREWINGQTEAKWFIDNRGRDFSRDWPAHIETAIYGK